MKDIFWTDLLKFFFELKTKEKIPLNVDSIIWYNSSLKIEGKTLFLFCICYVGYILTFNHGY
jgi:hypothetical protein